MSAILLTGASGFIGRALAARLAADGHRLRLALRSPSSGKLPDAGIFRFAGLDGNTDWREALAGIEIVVHCAARAHIMKESAADPLGAFRRCNADASAHLARQAALAGVRRLIFVSTAKVWGEQTPPGQPFTVDTVPAPVDPYAISKLEAENALRASGAGGGMEMVIVRPPLVYGPGVKANFLRLMQWIARGRPVPVVDAGCRRSLVARDNLVDLLARCVDHPRAANQILPVSDGEDLPMPVLLRQLGEALGKPARMIPVPAWLLKSGARLLGRQAMADRLCASLQIDIGHTRRLLDWSPPLSVSEALARTAADFLAHCRT
ncbi:MAG: NAD-dependent epimerase/dehydratase family protein [Azoarcus sp.]|nr:NAD-dependent epimerase/dehydratase family protein [Azoarcus sp.]